MTGPKDVSIKIGDVTLSTANVPKGGIDLNKLNEDTKNALSIFDKNNDGKLSAAEINDAIIKLKSADKTHSEVDVNDSDKTITTKKNGKLDDVELESAKFEYSKKLKVEDLRSMDMNTLNKLQKQLNEYSMEDIYILSRNKNYPFEEGRQKLDELITAIRYLNNEKNNGGSAGRIEMLESTINSISREMEHLHINLQYVLDTLANNPEQKQVASVTQLKNGAKALQKSIIRENEIKKNGLLETYNENWLKDTAGNHYRYNEQTMTFEKIPNVEYVAKDGSYRTREKNEKAQQIVKTYNKQDKQTIKVLNSENKAYTNPDYAAKVAGLEKTNNGYEEFYEDANNQPYVWDATKHTFRQTLIEIGF